MPDTYLDSSIVGFNHQDALDLKVDTYKRLSPILNMQDSPAIGPEFGDNLSSVERGTFNKNVPVQSIDLSKALISKDPNIKSFAQKSLQEQVNENPENRYGLNKAIESPYDDVAKKFITKQFGYSALRNNEDFYYRNDYMQNGWFARNLIYNPARFVGRVIVPGILKIGEGLGYVGSMLTSIGSNNYWADVADNGLSNWLEKQEQTFKDQVIPVYKQAGFDDKGFFSKLVDWSFWNESVADGVAFMASAAVPGMALGKLGTLGKFGEAFSSATKLGQFASKVGLGSGAELTSWAFNTGMEAAQEGAGVFKDSVRNMQELRAKGIGEYANMSDEDIRQRAGKLAANTVISNFGILSLSNAWENTLFFKPFKHPDAKLSGLTNEFIGRSSQLEGLASKNPFASGLSRTSFYGKKVGEAFLAEGLWEENAQLAVQRMNTIGPDGKYQSDRNFFSQLGHQTIGAFSGTDKEAAENIGLGGLIGIGGGVGISKLSGERKEIIKELNSLIDQTKVARDNLFSTNDIYERDENNVIKFENGNPLVSPTKLAAKKEALESIYGSIALANEKDFRNSRVVDFEAKRALASYVRSMNNIGIDNIHEKFSQLTPNSASMFGLDPNNISEKAGEYGTFAKEFEEKSKKVDDIKHKNPGLSRAEYALTSAAAKSVMYKYATDNTIYASYVQNETANLLDSFNKNRNIQNSSLSQFPVEQLNSLLYQKYYNEQVMKSKDFEENKSDEEKAYHIQRDKDLTEQIADYKKSNELALQDSREDGNGYYLAQVKDAEGNKKDVPFTKEEYRSLQKIAQYNNQIHKGNHVIDKLSSDDWYTNYTKLRETPALKAARAEAQAASEAYKSSVFSKYKENNKGDFKAVTRLVGKMISGETQFSPEELQLQSNYAKLVEDLIPVYKQAMDKTYRDINNIKLHSLINTRDTLLGMLFQKGRDLSSKEVAAQTLVESLQKNIAEGKLDLNYIQKLIYSTQDDINNLRDSIESDEKLLADYDRQIGTLQQEAESGDIQTVTNTLGELNKEKAWVENEIKEKKSLLDKLIKIIKDITNIAYKLFANIKGNYFVSRKQFEANLAKGRFEAVEAFNEIALKTLDKNDLESELNKLNNAYKDISDKVKYYTDLIDRVKQAVNDQIDAQYRLLTQEMNKASISDQEERKITDSFDELNNNGLSNQGSLADESAYDGPDYIRPLNTKFFTSTFGDIRERELSPEEKDHFEMLQYLTAPQNSKEVKQKLGKGKLSVIAVTQHNIEVLGLKGLLYTKVDKDDQAEYWEDKNTDTTRIDLVHVIEDKDGIHFVDKNLNKLGTIENIKEADKKKIARTILRANRFSEAEAEQYDVKYGKDKREKALKEGHNLRQEIIDKSKDFEIKSPTTVFGFTATRGTPNKFKNADNTYAKNAVSDVLMTEDQINGQSVVVTSKGNYTLNGQDITLPKGRAFIRTSSIFEDKLHNADNNFLDENTVNTIVKVLDNLSKSYVKILEETMSKKLDGKKLEELSYKERMNMIVEFNKTFKGNKFNINLLKYLNSIIYFGTLEKGEIAHPNKVFLKGSNIYFGKTAIDIVTGNFNNEDVKDFLSKQHHNIKYFADTKLANKPFTEYYLENGELEHREWKTYNHYLLSKFTPDGKERSYIPITTAIKTPTQFKMENNTSPYTTYESQAIILNTPFVENVSKNPVKVATGSVSFFENEDKPKENKKGRFRQIMEGLGGNISVDEGNNGEVKEEKPETKKGKFRRIMEEISAQSEEKPSTKTEIKDEDTDVSFNDDLTDNTAFRITKGGFFKTEADLDSVMAYASKVLPQFPVQRLKNAIRVSPTLEAFGQFTGSAIRLWEGAEEGTLYHEIFEAVANRILSDYEWRAIEKDFRSRTGSFVDRESGDTVSYKTATQHQVKEQIAEEFREFKLTGKLPTQPNTRTFFQVILDFIKNLFTHQATVNSLFKDIDEGKLADRAILAKTRFTSNYRTYPIPYQRYNEFLQGFSAYMFKTVFETPDSLVNLDELGEIDESIYEKVKAQLDDEYNTITEAINKGELPINTPNSTINEANSKLRKSINNTISNWDKIKDDWRNFVNNHKLFIRKFSIKFKDEYDLSEDNNDNKNRNDYSGNPFEISTKNTASSSVRFLVGTLLKSSVSKTKDGKYTTSLNQILPNITFQRSVARLPQLENYDRMMLMVLDKLGNLNDLNLIEQKLKELAGITAIQDAPVSEQDDIASNLTSDQAAMSLLYLRLFSPKKVISEEAIWNLKTKFLSYLSKQNPTPRIFMAYDGDSIILRSNERVTFENFNRKIQSSLIKNITDVFDIVTKDGKKTYVSNITSGEDKPNINDFLNAKGSSGKAKVDRFLKFLGLDDVITREFLKNLSERDKENYKSLVSTIFDARNALIDHSFTGDITSKNINIFGYTNKIIKILEEVNPQSEKTMTHLDGDNNARQNYVQPSFVSRILAQMANSKNLSELVTLFPHLKNSFSSDSILLKKMFDKDGERLGVFMPTLDYMDGIKDNEGKFKKTSRLEMHQRIGLQFIASLSGYYFSLPADSETEWMFNMGEFVEFGSDFLESQKNKIVNQIFIPKLRSEIQTALEFDKFKDNYQLNQKHLDGRVIGKSLRFFKDILQYGKEGKSAKGLISKINEAIDIGDKSPEEIIISNKKAIQEAISNYLKFKTVDTFNNLLENRIIQEIETEHGTVYTMDNLTTDLKDKFGGRGNTSFTLSQIRDIVAYGYVNNQIGAMEQFKLIFGDVAQYKDWEKRAKSLFSPVEQTFYDSDGTYNNWLNKEKNQAVFENEKVTIPENDMFRTNFSNTVNGRTVNDFITANTELLNTLERLGAPYKDKFEETNEADGQSIGTIQAIRHIMIKSGWRWTKENEKFFQYDTALARKELSEQGLYTYTSEELKALDNKILDAYKDDEPSDGPSPLKTLVPGVLENGTQILLKHSIYGISYQLAKDYPELLDLYISMLKRGDDIFNFKSAQKVGTLIDNKGEITSYYQKDGDSIDPFTKTDLGDVSVGNKQFGISLKTLGIQVETQSDKWGTTLGSQLTKDITLNLMPSGIPADFRAENEANTEPLSESQLREKWESLPDSDKMKSKNYKMVRDTMTTLENLKEKSVIEAFHKIGVSYKYKDGKLEYEPSNLKKLQHFILDELSRLEVDSNIIDGVKLTDDMDAFLNPSESLPSYDTVSNVIWSLADKSISSLKLNGNSYIQVSSAFFNKEGRKAAYKDGNKWVTVNTKEEYDAAKKAGKKLVLTSSELKFYSLNEGDTETKGMEILLPNFFKKKVNTMRQIKGLPKLSDEELLEHLNKNPKLLEGVGFRIPTQATSSLEFFTIKGFLPESFGKSIVVPSDITTKAGSDFDVDKLNTYLNNWRFNKEGLPVFENYLDDTNSTVEKRYDIVYGRKRSFFKKIETFLLNNYEKEILNNKSTTPSDRFIEKIFGKIDDTNFYNDDEIKEIFKEKGFDLDYNKLLEEVQEEIENTPTMEDFKKFPMHLQNTRGAVENEYFRSIRDILKQPERFTQLLSPNSMQNIKNNKIAVKTAQDANYQEDSKKELDYSRFSDMNYLVEKRQAFAKGKYDIGIFAVNMTNFANSQVTSLGITEGALREEDDQILKLAEYDISLPFAEASTQKINDFEFISLGTEKSADGTYVMDNMSGYVNGAVDVAKEPDIVEMGMHTDLAGAYMLLERAGISGKTLALFLYQPSIREYLKEMIFWKNKDFGYTTYEWPKQIREALFDKYSTKTPFYSKVIFTQEDMISMIRKGEKIKQEIKQIAEDSRNGIKSKVKVTEWTDKEKELQRLALINFLKINVFANNMNDVRNATNHDTAKIRSAYSLVRKELIRNKTHEGNAIMSPTKEGYRNGVDAIREDTFINKTIDLLSVFNKIFSKTNLFALQKDNPRNTLFTIAERIYKSRPFMGADDFDKIMKEYESSMIDTLLNNYTMRHGVQLSALLRQFFNQKQEVNGKWINTNNLSERFDNIKQLLTPAQFQQNFFLSNLSINFDQTIGAYTIGLKKNLGKGDILSRDLLIEGWRALFNSTNKEVSDFAEAMAIGSILQYGVKYKRGSITQYIPMEYYSKFSTAAISQIDNADFGTFDEEVIRENSYKSEFVPESIPMAMEFLNEDGTTINVWSSRNEENKKAKRRPKLSERRFIAEDEKIRPVYLWQKYLEDSDIKDNDFSSYINKAQPYIVVRMVRPEFISIVSTFQGKERGLKKIVGDMVKRKDFSWSFTQLYKLVGLDGTAPSVVKTSVSTAKASKGKISLSLLYKPVNSVGAYNFNEKVKVDVDEAGNVIGSNSILRPHMDIPEMKDDDIFEIVKKNPGESVRFVNFISEDINEAQGDNPTLTSTQTKELAITGGKPQVKSDKIAPEGKPPIEPRCK